MISCEPEFRLVDSSGLRWIAAIALLSQCVSNLRHVKPTKQLLDFLGAHRRTNQREPKGSEQQYFSQFILDRHDFSNGRWLVGGAGIREVLSLDYRIGGGRGERIGRRWRSCGLRVKDAISAGTLTGAVKMNPKGIKITASNEAPGVNAANRTRAIQKKMIGLRPVTGIFLSSVP